VIVADLAGGVIVEAGETGKVGGGDHRLARDQAEIAGELRPEGRLQIHFFAHRDGAGFRQGRLHIGSGLVQRFQGGRARQDGKMVLAVSRTARRDVVLGGGQLAAQADGVMIGGAQPAQRLAHA